MDNAMLVHNIIQCVILVSLCIQDLINEYTCSCDEGWSGENCDVNINDCDPNPCQNDGNCTVSSQESPLHNHNFI